MSSSFRPSPPPTPTQAALPTFTRSDEHSGPSQLSLSSLSSAGSGWPSSGPSSGPGSGVGSLRTSSGPGQAHARTPSLLGGLTGLGGRLKRSRSASGNFAPQRDSTSSDDGSAYTADDAASSRRSSIALTDGEDEYELDGAFADELASEPLVRRRRKKWDDEAGDKSLIELVAPLVLAHPLALFPALSNVPTEFLPAGVALFVPLFCVIAVLSACAHIVIVYLSWYLKVRTFEDVFAACVGERFGRYGLGVGRAFVLVSTMGATVGWLGSVYTLLEPMVTHYLPGGFLKSRITWTILSGLFLTPIVVPSRTLRTLRVTPVIIAMLFPIVAFVIIGRTVEVNKLATEAGNALVAATTATIVTDTVTDVATKTAKRGLRGLITGSAGSGLTTMVMFFTPQLLTLDVHSSLARTHRQQFGIPCLAAGMIIVVLSLPAALVPYYLLPEGPSAFALLPATDGWVNAARVGMAIIVLGSITLWLLRGRDTILAALDVDRGAERAKASRWVGALMWTLIVFIACIGGTLSDKIELLGVMATIAVGWLLPSVFFIITFHVRSPLAIIFPSHAPPPPLDDDSASASLLPRARSSSVMSSSGPLGHARTASLTDPAADHLLARKERQLQKRRLGRRLWQDLIVYVGILPIGCISLAWCVVSFVSVWR